MAGMLQILTYMLAFYIVLKGVEILQIAVASNREKTGGIIAWGVLVLIICIIAAVGFVTWQDNQASLIGHAASNF